MFELRSSILLLGLIYSAAAIHSTDDWAPQSWLFDWDSPGIDPTVSIPQTAQCEAIHIHWTRASGNVPDYVPPFYLRVYTSTYPAPVIVDAGSDLNFTWVVPFAPGTQYQICMVDSVGNSGGCQASYTVYPNNTFAIDPKTKNITIVPPSCANVTFPELLINATGIDANGPLTRMAWADQCTDISVTPTNGTPPYILTVAPTYHPPLNITSTNMDAINWTVTLGWAHQFYISLVDANGYSWSTGPLHSGGNGLTDCLVLGGNSLGFKASVSNGSNGISSGTAAGAAVGSLLAGFLLGGVISWWYSRPRRVDQPPQQRKGSTSEVDPYPLESEAGASRPTTVVDDMMSRSESPNSPRRMPSGMSRQMSDASSHHVYVVHHDAGRPPISVYHPEGASIVELPPSYGPQEGVSQDGGRSTPTAVQQPRPTRRSFIQKLRMANTENTTDTS